MSNDNGEIYSKIFLVLLSLVLLVIGTYIFVVYKKNIINYIPKNPNSGQVSTKLKPTYSDNIKSPNSTISPTAHSQANSKENSILLNSQKINLNQKFIISSDINCTSNIKARLNSIENDSIVIQPIQMSTGSDKDSRVWLPMPENDTNPVMIKNNTCISAHGLCMGDGGYKYCFSLNKADDMYNINYQAKFFPSPNSPYSNPPANHSQTEYKNYSDYLSGILDALDIDKVKTYSNEKYNFRFVYPKYLTAKTINNNIYIRDEKDHLPYNFFIYDISDSDTNDLNKWWKNNITYDKYGYLFSEAYAPAKDLQNQKKILYEGMERYQNVLSSKNIPSSKPIDYFSVEMSQDFKIRNDSIPMVSTWSTYYYYNFGKPFVLNNQTMSSGAEDNTLELIINSISRLH